MANEDNSTLNTVDLDKAFEPVEEKTDKGNPQEEAPFDVSNFLNDIDTQLSKTTKEEPQKQVETKETQPQNEVEELRQKLATLEKRYADSSREGKKIAELQKRLDEVEPAEKLYKTVLADPQLTDMVVSYIENGAKPSTSLKDQLGLPEDFIFDPEEVTKPGTDSYKFFQYNVQNEAKKIVRAELEQEKLQTYERTRKNELNSMQNAFVEKYGEDALEQVQEYMATKKLTLDDVWTLMTIGDRDRKIAKNAATSQAEQIRKNQEKGTSLATRQGAQIHDTDEDKIIGALKMLDGGVQF